ncbi:MAG: MarC family protein [Ignavibacteriae bacterium]|nr:MarC family protein [Ignavibacteriota bacterium]
MESFFTALALAFVALFPIVDPPGAIPVFCSLTVNSNSKSRNKTALKTSVNVFFVLLVFYLIGEFILDFFGISMGVLKIAGGIVVMNTAWEMLTSKEKISGEVQEEGKTKEDISFAPMALPLLSGPGAIGAVIGLSMQGYQADYILGISTGILLIAVSVYIALLLSIPLMKILGKTGIEILKKTMGFFILAIAVQLIVSGITISFKL